jgi:hypothetical protein
MLLKKNLILTGEDNIFKNKLFFKFKEKFSIELNFSQALPRVKIKLKNSLNPPELHLL